MKIRTGFVSNSSSSSFTIKKSDLNDLQIYAIRHHSSVSKELEDLGDDFFYDDSWSINEDKNSISGYTTMDNFDMEAFLSLIGVSNNVIDWRGY